MIKYQNLNNLNLKVFLHILFWGVFVVAGSFISGYEENFPYRFYLINFLINTPVYVLFTYFTVYVLIYRYLLKKRYLVLFLIFPLSLAVFSILKIVVNKFVFYKFFIPSFLHPEQWISNDLLFINAVWLLVPTVVFIAIKFYKDWVNSIAEKSEIEKRKLESELQLLKAQLNPHFLFNTLNNLYVLALQKSEKTPEIIAKISDLFHYILYECNAFKVPIEKELKLIENYIELEQIRYNDRLNLQLKKEVENENYLIMPMMLFTFVENCFKHGSSKDPDKSWINLKINQKGNSLSFIAENSLPLNGQSKKSNKQGVGLANINKRLDLMYAGNYKLNIKNNKSSYSVQLEIINVNE